MLFRVVRGFSSLIIFPLTTVHIVTFGSEILDENKTVSSVQSVRKSLCVVMSVLMKVKAAIEPRRGSSINNPMQAKRSLGLLILEPRRGY